MIGKAVPHIMKEVLQKAFSLLDNETENFCALSDKIWEIPETAFLEYESTAVLVKALKDYGFEVSEKVAGIDTAFLGRYGSGKPVIGIFGEYDALSGLSQKSCLLSKEPVIAGGAGLRKPDADKPTKKQLF